MRSDKGLIRLEPELLNIYIYIYIKLLNMFSIHSRIF